AAWVRAGGTLVVWRAQGVGVAAAAGLTSARVRAGDRPKVEGVLLGLGLDDGDPVAWGEQPRSFAFDAGDPVLSAGGAHVAGRYPGDASFFVSGYAGGTAPLRGSPAIVDDVVGAGRVVLFSFDPAYRGYAEGTERLVANALLAPRP
ncbi:MAG TPA: hypothetical protein VHB30_10395, partial [Solirubrobacteraceae bacterium]|nr:hypothetical protein [Solirubrobacteraceae bacterium]